MNEFINLLRLTVKECYKTQPYRGRLITIYDYETINYYYEYYLCFMRLPCAVWISTYIGFASSFISIYTRTCPMSINPFVLEISDNDCICTMYLHFLNFGRKIVIF